jgi:hypothetical protein
MPNDVKSTATNSTTEEDSGVCKINTFDMKFNVIRDGRIEHLN